MWSVFFFALFSLTAGCFFFVYRWQQRSIRHLNHTCQKIQLEERRVFDFLHGLGTALSDSSRPADLHALIVEGALRILEAGGGALYIADRKADQLRPTFISRSCPPFFEVTEAQRTQPGFSWQSFLRLRSVGTNDGLLGEAWRGREPLLLNGDDPRLATVRDSPLAAGTALLGPLIYGNENLGVLAIVRGAGDDPFGDAELQIFKTIAEQSAFALYNAIIFSQAA